MNCLSKRIYGYFRVGKRIVNEPLPNSYQYFLLNNKNEQKSSWIDVKLKISGDIVTVVNQIPKQLSAKMQMIKQLPKHPIMQDSRMNKNIKKTELRHYAIPLPQINYGFIPQTWQQNIYPDLNGYFGDNDPIDTIDLSQKDRNILQINQLKVLGAFCLIDQGQLDWKVLVIDGEEAKRKNVQSFKDIPRERISQIMNWFKVYKTYDGKSQNKIGFDSKVFDKEDTLKLIYQTHREFIKLKEGKDPQYKKRKQQFHIL